MTNPLILPDFKNDRITHGFFGRKGGVSEGIYSSLNCRNGSDDNPDHIKENQSRVKAKIGSDTLLTLYQFHSSEVVYAESDWAEERPKGDAMVTDNAGLALAILTADCGPILFHAQKQDGSPIIGAAHAGWRGAIGGVIENTIDEMIKRGANFNTLHAAIGPCIAQKSYEVGQEFFETFIHQNQENRNFFIENPANAFHYMFDLQGYCAHRLKVAGVQNIALANTDTYSNEDTYFSHRRATHNSENGYGGQVSVIMIKK